MTQERRTGWEEADKWFASDAGGADGGDTPPPDADDSGGEPPTPRCEVCGAELEPDQTYCLECGSPTPLAPRIRRGRKGMAIMAGAVAVLGLGAGALAYAVASDDDGGSAATVTTSTAPLVPGTTPLPPVTAPTTGGLPPDTSLGTVTTPSTDLLPPSTVPSTTPTGFETVTGPSSTPSTTTTTTEATTVAPPTTDSTPVAPSGDSDWPAGRTAWTAILSSVRSESDARAAKSRLAASGEPAGVLLSTDFPDLRPGYWVVFSGTYDDRAAAVSQAASLAGEFPGAYARHLQG